MREEFGEGQGECGEEVEEPDGCWGCRAEESAEEGEDSWDVEMRLFFYSFSPDFLPSTGVAVTSRLSFVAFAYAS